MPHPFGGRGATAALVYLEMNAHVRARPKTESERSQVGGDSYLCAIMVTSHISLWFFRGDRMISETVTGFQNKRSLIVWKANLIHSRITIILDRV